jgi:hypothetical protein
MRGIFRYSVKTISSRKEKTNLLFDNVDPDDKYMEKIIKFFDCCQNMSLDYIVLNQLTKNKTTFGKFS